MVVSGVAAIYERHIRALAPNERLELLAIIARDLAAAGAAEPGEPKHSIMELHGLGKEIWEGIDAQEYVDAIRDGTDLPAIRGSVDRA